MKEFLAVIMMLSVLLTACGNSTTQDTSNINNQEVIDSEIEPVATTAQITAGDTEEVTTEAVVTESTEAITSESVTEKVTNNSDNKTALPDIYDYLEYDAIYLQNYLTDCGATNVYFKEMSFEDTTGPVGVMAEFQNWSLLIWFYPDYDSTTNVQQFTLYSADGSEEYILEANYSDGRLVISGYEYRIAAEILYVLPQLIQDIVEKEPVGEFVFNQDNIATVSKYTN